MKLTNGSDAGAIFPVADAGRLRIFPTDRFKTANLSVLTVLPVEYDTVALYRLLLSVLCRGTARYPSQKEINRCLDLLYAAGITLRCGRYGDRHVLGLRAEFLEQDYVTDGTDVMGGVLDLMKQILLCPLTTVTERGVLFSSDYVDSEKQLMLDAIHSMNASPKTYALRRCCEMMGEGDSLAVPILGTEEQVSLITPEQLGDAHRLLFGEKGVPFDFVYTGSCDAEMVHDRLVQSFGSYHSQKASLPPPRLTPITGKLKRLEEAMPVAQARLVIGFCTGVSVSDPEFYAMMVANELFGVSPVSRLFVYVREKKSLCYHCSSSYDFYKGVIYVTSGIRNENREAAEEEIFRQLEALRRGDFSDGELDAAKKSLENSYRRISDHPATLEGYYYGRSLFSVFCSVEETMERFHAVTKEQVMQAACRMIPEAVFFLRGDGADDGEVTEDE